MAQLSFKIEKLPESPLLVVLGLCGPIDSDNTPRLKEELGMLQRKEILHFILDMAQMTRVNSTGLGVLVNLADTLERSGGELVLTRIPPEKKVVFEALGLTSFFHIFSTLTEAIFSCCQKKSIEITPSTPEEIIEMNIQLNDLQRRGANLSEILSFLLKEKKRIGSVSPHIFSVLNKEVNTFDWNLLVQTAYVFGKAKQFGQQDIPRL
ncbi:MAG: STAS domain-containing protein [Planctomycetota bacterium]